MAPQAFALQHAVSIMEEPYTVASLPKPLDSQHGRILAAPVFGLAGSRKRKRHEVVVGIDGESVNTYNVQTQNSVASYPLPPQTYLTTNPCSIFCKHIRSATSQRQTVLTVGERLNSRNVRLVSFVEDYRRKPPTGSEFSTPVKRDRALRNGGVISLDIVPLQESESQASFNTATIVSYKNGDIDCISINDMGSIWEYTAVTDSDEHDVVQYATTVDFETACKGLLRNREDVIALLRPMSDDVNNGGTPLLFCQILRQQQGMKLKVSSIDTRVQPRLQTRHSVVQELFTHTIASEPQSQARYELHPSSGLLYQRRGSRLKIFDVSKITPQLIFTSSRKGPLDVTDSIRLSGSAVLLLSETQATIYETKYGSVLSSLSFSSKLLLEQNHQNGDSDCNDGETYERRNPECVSSFSDLGLVVALAGNRLLALQYGRALSEAKESRSRGPLLIDVLGKSRPATNTDLASGVSKSKKRKRLLNWKEQVDQFVEAKDLDSLEQLIAEDLHLVKRARSRVNGVEDLNGHSDEHGSSRPVTWNLGPQTYDSSFIDTTKAMYILGKTFRWRTHSDDRTQAPGQLDLVLKSWNIVRWLAMAGFLNANQIQLALSQQITSPMQGRLSAPGAIMNAIAQFDPELSYIRKALVLPVSWDIYEVLEGTKLLINTVASHNDQPADRPSIAEKQIDGEVFHRKQSAMELGPIHDDHLAANNDLELRDRLRALRPVLECLQAFPHEKLAEAMRLSMTNDEILVLIGILRLMLSNAGWTSQYVNVASDTSSHDAAICSITNLLSTAVDAIGAVGWIVGSSSNMEDTENLIACLRAEVSAALEGCYEARTLDTILQDLRHYEGSFNESSKRKSAVMTERVSGLAALPLGSSAAPPVVFDRTLWEGRKRPLSRVQDQGTQVGQYAFEQIRV